MFFMFPSLLSSKPFPLQPLLAALSSPPPLSRPLSRFSACSQICCGLALQRRLSLPLSPLPPFYVTHVSYVIYVFYVSLAPFLEALSLAASACGPLLSAAPFAAPFFPRLPWLFPCHNFGAGEGFSLGAAFSLSPLFFLFQGFSPHLSSFSLAIILVPAKALASGPLSRFRRFSCYHSYRSYRSYHSYRGCKRRGRGCAKITSGEHHCPPEASR